jgi:hypothetical protein
MRHQKFELKRYKHQKLMNELNDMMIRIKVHLFLESTADKMAHSKPKMKEIDELTNKIMKVLQKDNEPLINY